MDCKKVDAAEVYRPKEVPEVGVVKNRFVGDGGEKGESPGGDEKMPFPSIK